MAPVNGLAPLGPVARLTDEADAQRKIANRLKRSRGQLGAVIAALESGAACPATLTQLSAVSGAVNRAKYAIISSAMRECLSPTDAEGKGHRQPDHPPARKTVHQVRLKRKTPHQ